VTEGANRAILRGFRVELRLVEMELFGTCGRVVALTGFGGVGLLYMRRAVLIIALPLFVLTGLAQSQNCLRVMPIDDVIREAILIARVKVHKVEKAKYRGEFDQLAVLYPVDVIEGDFTLGQMYVLARSRVRCAEDNYVKEEEMLVFLEPQDSLFHTVNYQYGQFPIVGEIVKGWRDKANKPIDKPYEEVRRQILMCIADTRNPKPEAKPPQPKPVKPPEQPAP
jgi:hypothetical protein